MALLESRVGDSKRDSLDASQVAMYRREQARALGPC